jgi:hypothetical protein
VVIAGKARLAGGRRAQPGKTCHASCAPVAAPALDARRRAGARPAARGAGQGRRGAEPVPRQHECLRRQRRGADLCLPGRADEPGPGLGDRHLHGRQQHLPRRAPCRAARAPRRHGDGRDAARPAALPGHDAERGAEPELRQLPCQLPLPGHAAADPGGRSGGDPAGRGPGRPGPAGPHRPVPGQHGGLRRWQRGRHLQLSGRADEPGLGLGDRHLHGRQRHLPRCPPCRDGGPAGRHRHLGDAAGRGPLPRHHTQWRAEPELRRLSCQLPLSGRLGPRSRDPGRGHAGAALGRPGPMPGQHGRPCRQQRGRHLRVPRGAGRPRPGLGHRYLYGRQRHLPRRAPCRGGGPPGRHRHARDAARPAALPRHHPERRAESELRHLWRQLPLPGRGPPPGCRYPLHSTAAPTT